jgi:hypothetical protein
MRFSTLVTPIVAACCASSALAASLDARPGLWERTATTQMEGTPVAPVADLSKLPPDRRAQIETMMAARTSTTPTASVLRQCVTPEMLKQWDAFSRGERDDSGCARTVIDQSARNIRIAMVCAGGKETGTADFSAASPDRVTGTITMVRQEERGERKVRIDIDTRWLGADCGNVKPGESQPVKG